MGLSLKGRLILIAEDEPLIALEMTLAFEDAGAWVIRAYTLSEALRGAEDPALSAVVLDHALSDGDSSAVYERMTERDIPFVTYGGYDRVGETRSKGAYVKKPAPMSELVATVQCLIAERQASNRQLSVNRQLSILEGDAVANTPQRAAMHLS